MLTKEEIEEMGDEELIDWIYENACYFYADKDGLYIEVEEGFDIMLEWDWDDFIAYTHRPEIRDFIRKEYLERSKSIGKDMESAMQNLNKLFSISSFSALTRNWNNKKETADEFLRQIYDVVQKNLRYSLLHKNIRDVRKKLEYFAEHGD